MELGSPNRFFYALKDELEESTGIGADSFDTTKTLFEVSEAWESKMSIIENLWIVLKKRIKLSRYNVLGGLEKENDGYIAN